MASSAKDRISVDLRGLRAALFEWARAAGVSPSHLVREVVARSLGYRDAMAGGESPPGTMLHSSDRVRLSLRLNREEARTLVEAVERAGVPIGIYVSSLAAGVPLFAKGGMWQEHVGALVASSAELATLARNVYHLTTLLQRGEVRAALEYAQMLKTLDRDIRSHLALAAGALSGLKPSGRASGARSGRRQGHTDMPHDIDGVLVQWGDRLFYPANRVVHGRTTKLSAMATRRRAAVIRARIAATVGRRVPQVMVKVTGGGRGMKAIAAHFRYISKNGRLDIEDERGQVSRGKDALPELADDWRFGGMLIDEVGYRREAFNIMLSMPRGTDPLSVQWAAREFAGSSWRTTSS